MKKIIMLLILFMPINVLAINAKSYVVMDMDNKIVIMGSNYHEPMLIASTSKIMTCIIALENSDINKMVTINKEILKVTGSSLYLEIGEKIKLKDLLYGLMLRSGNDAAVMIATEVSGSMNEFSDLMNNYAKKIGMKDSVFYNSHGLEDEKGIGNISTSYDMALLMRYAMKNNYFRKIVSTKEYRTKSNRKSYLWYNKNKLLNNDYITGGKTGYTKRAHRTLVTSGSINNMNIVIVTLNDSNDWKDHTSLYQKINNNYQKVKVLDKKDFRIIEDGVYLDNNLYIKKDLNIIVHDNNLNDISIKYYINNGIKKGKIGYAKVYISNRFIAKRAIYKQGSR